jgi:mannose-6-phosphate isomerase-like protein (cupin superfamily)
MATKRIVSSNKLDRERILIAEEEAKEDLGFFDNIEKDTVENEYFRKVINTTEHSQLVLMTIQPGEDIPNEVHHNSDQFFRFEAGTGEVIINDGEEVYKVKDGDSVTVPAGVYHRVVNTSDNEALKLYAIYSPPQHEPGQINKTREDAIKAEKQHEEK